MAIVFIGFNFSRIPRFAEIFDEYFVENLKKKKIPENAVNKYMKKYLKTEQCITYFLFLKSF